MKDRLNYGKRFEPIGNYIIHGAGQSKDDFIEYYNAVGEFKPLIYMAYYDLKTDPIKFFEQLNKNLNEEMFDYIVPQIGVCMTRDGKPEMHYESDVANGVYDENIMLMCEKIKEINRPVYLRIGYEFNGQWNGYERESYKKAFRRIVEFLRLYKVNNAAVVWCYSPDGIDEEFMEYYPGDEFVDWWGIDLFDKSHFDDSKVERFMMKSLEKGFPVMIGETTPRYVGTLENSCWNEWFEPFFSFMDKYQNIKAFCYISWDWSQYEYWQNWGDARIWKNSDLLNNYICTLGENIFLHSSNEVKTNINMLIEHINN